MTRPWQECRYRQLTKGEGARGGCKKMHGGELCRGAMAAISVLQEVHEDC
jgi:hypothetical protein